jgi:O-antigen ligase
MIIYSVPLILLTLIIASSVNIVEESVTVRNDLNRTALLIWRDSPVFGTGLGNFIIKLPDFPVERSVYFLQPVHNIYLLILAETGLFGVGGLFLLLFCIIKHLAYDIRRQGKKIIKHYYPYIFPLAVILLIGLADHYPITLQQGQLMTTLALVLPLAYGTD